MDISIAQIETAGASRYITRLCKHWGHSYAVKFDASHGYIDFGDTMCWLEATASHLDVKLESPPELMEELELALVDHLLRFAPPGEPLHVLWQRMAKSAPKP